MAALGRDLEMSLAEIDQMSAREYEDWALLYEVEAQAREQQAENERRQRERL